MENRDSAGLSREEGRRFGYTVGSAFGLLCGLSFWRGHQSAAWILGSAGTVLILSALMVPDRMGPVHRAWMGLARMMSKVTTPIFMGAVYFLVLTPAGFLVRTLGRNPIRHEAEEGGYWQSRPVGRRSSDMNRQF